MRASVSSRTFASVSRSLAVLSPSSRAPLVSSSVTRSDYMSSLIGINHPQISCNKRTMSTIVPVPAPPAGKYEWLVVVPDIPGTAAKRLEVRASHLEKAGKRAADGMFKTGGALLNNKPDDPSDPSSFSFAGSCLVCVAASRTEIMGVLEEDIYAKSGVWDLTKVQMWPATFGFRNP